MSSEKEKEMMKGDGKARPGCPPPAYSAANSNAGYPRLPVQNAGPPPSYSATAPSYYPPYQYPYGSSSVVYGQTSAPFYPVVPQHGSGIPNSVTVVMPEAFDAQARFDHITRPNIPPPPPGVAPNMAQMAMMNGQSNQVVLGQKEQSFW